MKKTLLRNYARLIVNKGIHVRDGQDVVIQAALDQPEFVCMVADECYKAGARKVHVEWSYQPMQKITYRHCSFRVLSKPEDWEMQKLAHRADTLPAVIYLESEDPNGLQGINQEKVAKVQQARYPLIKPFRDKMENKYQWCIAAVPGEKWAKRIFPELRSSQAIEKLWEMILYTSRADGEDPLHEWDAHNEDLASRCKYLNNLKAVELRYHTSGGTDFHVGLIPDALFMGGAEETLSGWEFNPNIPSEEVYTSPLRGKAEGTVVSTLPLSYRGMLIENFALTFKEGRVVEVHAEKNEDLLRSMIAMDDGAAYLGECALVPHNSPIQNSGVTFFNTLFDENASCHLALGAGFNNCIRGYETKTLEECRSMGINDSIIHVDFMIGSPDLAIDAVDTSGAVFPIFRNGNWAF